MTLRSIITAQDSYKYSQFNQYPLGTTRIFSYVESRGGKWDQTVFFGAQMFVREYLTKPITQKEIDRAEALLTAHGEPFNREGWEYILRVHGGRLPVIIKAVPEGTVIDGKNVLLTIENTDDNCYWLTSFLETALLRAIWYPVTVATNSYESKKIIAKYLLQTEGNLDGLQFMLHDFGARGVSSLESAGIGGAAHLVNFYGTDTVTALEYVMEYYDMTEMPAFSVPAMEHSTVTSWGREGEEDAYRNMVKKNGKPGGIVSAVSDSYDIYAACEMWGTKLKQDIIDSGARLVVRPDSGDPVVVISKCMRILEQHFGATVNAKGFKVLNNVRMLWGDGINHLSIDSILMHAMANGYSAANFVFGQGGALLQQLDRDTLKFAMKCSAALVNGEWRDVYKDPVTDQGKRSKKGRLALVKTDAGYETVREDELNGREDVLQVIYNGGDLFNQITFPEVRANANGFFEQMLEEYVAKQKLAA